jgi:hypothetical protein
MCPTKTRAPGTTGIPANSRYLKARFPCLKIRKQVYNKLATYNSSWMGPKLFFLNCLKRAEMFTHIFVIMHTTSVNRPITRCRACSRKDSWLFLVHNCSINYRVQLWLPRDLDRLVWRLRLHRYNYDALLVSWFPDNDATHRQQFNQPWMSHDVQWDTGKAGDRRRSQFLDRFDRALQHSYNPVSPLPQIF